MFFLCLSKLQNNQPTTQRKLGSLVYAKFGQNLLYKQKKTINLV